MHVCKISSSLNSSNNYYITFSYSYNPTGDEPNNVHINDIVNYIRLKYILDNKSCVAEYDNIEYEIIRSISNLVKTEELNKTTTTTTTTTTIYKLLLNRLNSKLQLLPPNTQCEINVFFKKEIDEPSLMISK